MSKAHSKKNIKIAERLTLKQKKAIKHLLEKGGSVGEAMRVAQYSPATVKNPSHLTKSKGFIKVLEAAGLTDEFLAKSHQELMQASRIDRLTFPAITREVMTTKGKNGKKLKHPISELVDRHVPDEMIRMQVESVPGVKLMYIQKGYKEKIAYIKVPENPVRKSAIEMGYKVKDHFAAQKLDVITHELSEDETELLLTLVS